jgi:Protein of unknown function (DUF1571)
MQFLFRARRPLPLLVTGEIKTESSLRSLLLRAVGVMGVLTLGAFGAQAQISENAAFTHPASVQQQVPPVQPQTQQVQPDAKQHPLVPALEMAYKTKQNIETNLKDYSAIVVKHERIDGVLGDEEKAFIKVREKPFSVYMGFISPDKVKGQECMYIDGANNNEMFAHAPPGSFRGKFGTVQISPTSAIAMKDQRYPITELGVANLTKRLIEVGEHDKQYGECEVKFFQGAKVNGRECTVIQVTHPVPRRSFVFHMARIYVDDQLGIPIRYEAYDWPAQPGGPPELLEEYTYMNLKINQGLTDADFDVHNPQYGFNKK